MFSQHKTITHFKIFTAIDIHSVKDTVCMWNQLNFQTTIEVQREISL